MQLKILKTCLICNKKFEGIKKSKYCSKKCSDKSHYLRHKEYYKDNSRRWQLENPDKRKKIAKKALIKFRTENPERFNELMMISYKNNKNKWHSRSIINNILNGRANYKKDDLGLIKKCKKCSSEENLEIHHEIYPTKKQEIIQATADGKIYYLCRDCHGRRNCHDSMNT